MPMTAAERATREELIRSKRWGSLTPLTVAFENDAYGVRRHHWTCTCTCGRTVRIEEGHLMKRRNDRCPCDDPRVYREELVGGVYGTWEVLRIVPERSGFVYCRCTECGVEREVFGTSVRRGKSRSCGCVGDEKFIEANTVHGMWGQPEYVAWSGMVGRCCNPAHPSYPDYGGAGITVCDRWRTSFAAFYEDMGPRPSENHSLHRDPPDANYTPETCVWALPLEQGRVKRTTIWVEHEGERLPLSEWAERLGVHHRFLYYRIVVAKWPAAEALTVPPGGRKSRPVDLPPEERRKYDARGAFKRAVKAGRITKPELCESPGCTNPAKEGHHHKGYSVEHQFDVVWLCVPCHARTQSKTYICHGVERTVAEWAEHLGLSVNALRARLKNPDWSIERALSTPKIPADAPKPPRRSRYRQLTPRGQVIPQATSISQENLTTAADSPP